MELNLNSARKESNLRKHFFSLKANLNDGLLLQIHHSYSDAKGVENKKFRFIYGSFNDSGTYLAVADHKGHVFIINFELEKYWELPNLGIPTFLSFFNFQKHKLLIGLDTSCILLVNTECGDVIGVFNGHSIPANEISYSDDGHYFLTSNSSEAIIWDSSTFSQVHRLSLKSDMTLKKVLFMPVTNQILACFQDDTMHIWKFGTFECIKQIVPETWKTHHLKAIALTKNGRALVIAGHSPSLVIFCLDTWAVMKVVEFPEFISGIRQMEFIPQVFDGGANKILAMLTTSLELYFFDIDTSTFLKGMHQIFGITVKFIVSNNGKYIASFLTTGEINVYLTGKILFYNKQLINPKENISALNKSNSYSWDSKNYSNISKKTPKSIESLKAIKKKLHEVLDSKKLFPILKEFGEYPESYRTLIWKTILKLPANQESFVSLSIKKCPLSYLKLESKYPLVNKSLYNSLQKLLSNLSHWCPLFSEVEFLPEFVFPFVKLFHSDPLACFETVATIIVNWCQNWFEFYPFPPINMLSAMENILGYHDPDLLEFYLKNNITSSVSICSLFHTAFSEVLSKNEWLKFWDHVLSNEPSFLFMAIIAYNVICRNVIKTFSGPTDLEKFFHKQNSVDMKMLITKTYQFLKETPDEIHSRQFFSPFQPLGNGGIYITFIAYPKLIVDPSTERLRTIRKEEEELLEEQLKALNIKKKLDKKLLRENKTDYQEKIYKEVEEKLRKLVEDEEDRVLVQRQKLQNLRHELRIKELEVLEEARTRALNERIKKKEMEFQRLFKDVSKRKAREKMEVDVIEEEIRKYYSELLLRKCQLEVELGLEDENIDVNASLELHRKKFQNDLVALKNEWETLYHSKRIEFSNKMAAVKALIHDLETDMAKEMTEKDSEKYAQENWLFINHLKNKVKSLEDEIENLIKKNLSQLKRQKMLNKNSHFSHRQKFLGSRRKKLHEKIICPEQQIINQNSPDEQKLIRNTEKSNSQKPSKTISKIVATGVRNSKISPEILIKKSKANQISESNKTREEKMLEKDINIKKSASKIKSSHPKSKLTCPANTHELLLSSHLISQKNLRNNSKLSESETSCKTKSHNWQFIGDFNSNESLNVAHDVTENLKKINLSKSAIKKDITSDEVKGEEEIINSAFKVRKQLIKEAKIRQIVEQKETASPHLELNYPVGNINC